MRAFIVFGVICLTFVSCSDDAVPPVAEAQPDAAPAASPEQVVENFVQAANTGDQAALEETLTEKARAGLTQGGGFSVGAASYSDYTIGQSSIAGDTASVPLTVVEDGEPQAMTMQLRRENGQWGIYAMAIEAGEGVSFTADLETLGESLAGMAQSIGEEFANAVQTSMEDAFTGGSQDEIAQERAQFDAVAPMTEAAFEAAWRNTVDYRGRTSAEAITELAAALELPVYFAPQADALQQEVSVDVTGISRLEAIARIAAEVGLAPVFPQENAYDSEFAVAMGEALVSGMESMVGGKLTNAAQEEAEATPAPPADALQFAERDAAKRTVYSGPFVIAVAEIEDNAPRPTGEITFAVRAYGLPAPVAAMAAEHEEGFVLAEMVDAQSRSLFDDSTTWLNEPTISNAAFANSHHRELINLTRDVDRVARVSGVQRVTLPLAVESLRLDAPAKDQSQTVGPLTFTVRSVSDTNIAFDVTGPDEAVKALKAKFRPLNADGEDIGLVYGDVTSWNDGKAMVQAQSGKPAAAWELKLITAAKTLEFPFDFADIPLPNAAERPETIAVLEFGDEKAPLSLSFVEKLDAEPDFPKVRLKVTNHSNKEPMVAHVNFVYLDSTGQELDDFPQAVSGAHTADGQEALAAPGASAQLETFAFQMPEATADIRVEVNRVDFNDGTVWDAKD